MNLLETLRSANDAISKFYDGSYHETVQNPVLLLNYLYQHSHISRPNFTVIIEEKNPPHFVVSCVVDEVRTHGSASSKKVAKTRSAQEMIDLIRNSENNPNLLVENCDDLSPETSYLQIMTDCEAPPQHALSFDPSDDLVQPQWDDTEIPLTLKRAYSEATTTEYSIETDCHKAIGNTNGQFLSLEDYFDPYYHMKTSSQSSVSSTNSDAENVKPSLTDEDTVKRATKSKNRSKKEAKRAKLSTPPTSYVLESYFDPFSKVKPPAVSYADGNSSRTCGNAKVNEVREEPDLNKSDKASTSEAEVPKVEKTKSPFAILQEKSIKNMKLIPRCKIDKDGEGFKCKLVLDSFSSEGTGQSKKLAKINAAIDLLSQLEERS